MRRVRSLLAAGLLVGAFVAPATVQANNDPHRFFLPSGPLDIPAEWCGFSIQMDALVNREYGTDTILPDGTEVLRVTGSLMLSFEANGKEVMVNGGGPGTLTFTPDGMFYGDLHGRSFLFAPNLTDFGFPSNAVAVAGHVHLVQTLPGPGFDDVTGDWTVITDVCAALS